MPRTKKAPAPAIAPAAGELSPLEIFALSKAPRGLDKLRRRLAVANGQPVDFTVRVSGAVNVAADSSATVTESAGADQVLAAVLSQIKPRAQKELAECVRGLFAEYRRGGEAPAFGDEAVDLADDLLASAARQVNASRKGAVSGALSIELVDRA